MSTAQEKASFPLDRLAIGKDPEATALVTRSGSLSYKMLNHRVGQLASWLQAQGLDDGDRVAAWLPKTELSCLMPLAAARAGFVFVPVNPVLKPAQVRHILEDSGAKLLIANSARVKALADMPVNSGCAVHDEKAVLDAVEHIAEPMAPSDPGKGTDTTGCDTLHQRFDGTTKGSHAQLMRT